MNEKKMLTAEEYRTLIEMIQAERKGLSDFLPLEIREKTDDPEKLAQVALENAKAWVQKNNRPLCLEVQTRKGTETVELFPQSMSEFAAFNKDNRQVAGRYGGRSLLWTSLVRAVIFDMIRKPQQIKRELKQELTHSGDKAAQELGR